MRSELLDLERQEAAELMGYDAEEQSRLTPTDADHQRTGKRGRTE